jgi:hypothetical protein
MQWSAPAFDVEEKLNAENYKMIIRYPKESILESGVLDGESIISGKAALLRVKYKAGEVILYGFTPHWRVQTYGTFKLLFNMLYK